jgi:hypothetical protein
VKPSLHSRTAGGIVERFMDRRICFEERADGCHLVTVR